MANQPPLPARQRRQPACQQRPRVEREREAGGSCGQAGLRSGRRGGGRRGGRAQLVLLVVQRNQLLKHLLLADLDHARRADRRVRAAGLRGAAPPCIRLRPAVQGVRTGVTPRAGLEAACAGLRDAAGGRAGRECAPRACSAPSGHRRGAAKRMAPTCSHGRAGQAECQLHSTRGCPGGRGRVLQQPGGGPALPDSRPGLLQGRAYHARLRGLDECQRCPTICRHPLRAPQRLRHPAYCRIATWGAPAAGACLCALSASRRSCAPDHPAL